MGTYQVNVDKFNNAHVTLLQSNLTENEMAQLKHSIQYLQQEKRNGKYLSVFVNIPYAFNWPLGMLHSIIPYDFPINPIRDDQEQCFRFLDGPASVPTGGNMNIGATAIVCVGTKVLVVTNAKNGRKQYPGGRYEHSDGTLVRTAIRECFEETGYQIDTPGELLGIQFFPKNQFARGINFVYRFTAAECTPLHVDGVEISHAEWMDVEDTSGILPPYNLKDNCWSKKLAKGDWYEFWC